MIHTTIGVYPNGSHKVNGVTSENLAGHILYNTDNRPGRTLIVDDVILYKGLGCSIEDAQRIALEVTKQTKDTQPYV